MTDAEVGELWRKANSAPVILAEWGDEMKRLIRKLIEERERESLYNHPEGCRCESDPRFHLKDALRDFGIDPKTWEVKP